jgi:hypothetical protein
LIWKLKKKFLIFDPKMFKEYTKNSSVKKEIMKVFSTLNKKVVKFSFFFFDFILKKLKVIFLSLFSIFSILKKYQRK